jgi:hypothetical protein
VIIRLKQGALHVSRAQTVQERQVVHLWNRNPGMRHERWLVLMSDFEIVKRIAADIILRSSPYESLRQVEDRIRARVEVEFAGRGVPA